VNEVAAVTVENVDQVPPARSQAQVHEVDVPNLEALVFCTPAKAVLGV
jgi:hypothetical protein